MPPPVAPKSPKDEVRTTWVDSVDETGARIASDEPKKSKYFKGITVHADGSTTVTVYERGTNNVVTETPGPPDAEQQKIWQDEQKSTQTQTDQAERQVAKVEPNAETRQTTITYRDGSTTVRPATKDELASVGVTATTPADENAAELQRQREKNAALPKDQDPRYETDAERANRGAATIKEQGAAASAEEAKGKKTYGAPYQNAQGAWVRPWTDGRGGTGVESLPPEAIPKGKEKAYTQLKQDDATGIWWGLTPEGKWEQTQGGPGKPAEKPTIVEDKDSPTGRSQAITAPDGTVTLRPILREGDQAGPGPKPPEESLPTIGDMTGWLQRRKDFYDAEQAAGRMSDAQKQKALQADAKLAQTRFAEQKEQIDTANSVLSSDVTQRGQDTSRANTRMSAATTTYGDVLKTVTAGHLKPGTDVGDLAAALLELGRRNATAFGGMETPERAVPFDVQTQVAGPRTGQPVRNPGQPAPGMAGAGGAPAPGGPSGVPAAAAPGAVPGVAGAPPIAPVTAGAPSGPPAPPPSPLAPAFTPPGLSGAASVASADNDLLNQRLAAPEPMPAIPPPPPSPEPSSNHATIEAPSGLKITIPMGGDGASLADAFMPQPSYQDNAAMNAAIAPPPMATPDPMTAPAMPEPAAGPDLGASFAPPSGGPAASDYERWMTELGMDPQSVALGRQHYLSSMLG